MVIPHVFDVNLKSTGIASILSQEGMSQSLDMDLTYFHSLIDEGVRCSN